MKYYFLFLLLILSSCENKTVCSVYKTVDSLYEVTKAIHDSALINLEIIHSKNDSLLDIHFPKK